MRFTSNPLRVQQRDVLVPLLAEMVKRKTKKEWIAQLEEAGVPCGPINNLDEVFSDPQVVARGMCVEMPHPTAGKVSLVGSPMKMSATPVNYAGAPPLLGEDTEQILSSLLHYSPEKITELKAAGIISQHE